MSAGPDTTTVLKLYLALLICIPTSLVFPPIGTVATPANAAALGIAGLWALGKAAPHLGLAGGRQPVRILIGVFALTTLASYVVASTIPLSGVELRSADSRLLQLIAWVGVALLAADGVRDRARLDSLLRWLVLLGAVLGLLAFLQYVWGIDLAASIRIPGLSVNEALRDSTSIQVRYGVRRAAGTTTHPIELGAVLALILPLALHYAVHAPASRRLYQWGQLALVGLGALVSVSRGATLGIAVALVTVFAAWPRELRRRALLASPLIALALPSIAPGVLGTLRGLFSNVSNDPSVAGRTDDYALIMPFVREHPLLGRGFGAFIPQLYPLPGGRSGGYLILDNEYLSTLIQKGIVGVVVLLALFLGAFLVARAARRAATDPVTRDLAQALAAAILVPTVTFAGFDGLSFPMIAGLTFLTVGVIGALWRVTQSRAPQVTPSALRAASAVRGLPSPSRP